MIEFSIDRSANPKRKKCEYYEKACNRSKNEEDLPACVLERTDKHFDIHNDNQRRKNKVTV